MAVQKRCTLHALGTREEFLKMVASQGGELACDIVKALWEAGKLSAEASPEITQICSTLTLRKLYSLILT